MQRFLHHSSGAAFGVELLKAALVLGIGKAGGPLVKPYGTHSPGRQPGVYLSLQLTYFLNINTHKYTFPLR